MYSCLVTTQENAHLFVSKTKKLLERPRVIAEVPLFDECFELVHCLIVAHAQHCPDQSQYLHSQRDGSASPRGSISPAAEASRMRPALASRS